jgi:uncharacterized RDD family membrane protein YckC
MKLPLPGVTAPPRAATQGPLASAPQPRPHVDEADRVALGATSTQPRVQSHHALTEDALPQASTAVVAAHAEPPQASTAVLPPHRAEPPSPTAFAHARQPMPQVTPASPTMGAVVPEGQMTAAVRPEPMHRPAVIDVIDDAPEPLTVPAAPIVARPAAQAAPPPKPAVLPPSMLVTQPGLPGPFAAAREIHENPSIPQRPASLPEVPRVAEPAPVAPAPVFDEPVAARGDVVTAEPASLWRRTGAWLADLGFVVGLVLGFLFIAMTVIAPKNLTPVQQLVAIAAPGGALAAVLAFVYTTIFAFLWNGRTPGRRIFGIHLVDVTGHAPAPARALLRAMLSLVSFGLFLSGFWLALFDRHGQTLHDKLTRTFVVKLQDA